MKKLFLALTALALLALPALAWCEDGTPGPEADVSQDGTVTEPAVAPADMGPLRLMLKPELAAWLGYRIVDVQGSNRAIQYGWPHSSVAGGFVFTAYPLPYRFDTELDWLNLYDYRAESSSAYKDMVKLDFTGVALWHNLDHLVPQAFRDEKNPGWTYGVAVNDNRVSLRLKWPDRAYHMFFQYRQFDKDGVKQATWYEGGTPPTKGSKERDIYWVTRRFIAGLNGHVGPVELEYFHTLKTFHAGADTVLTDPFNGTPLIHSVMPRLETNSDTLRAHTDYTGRVVAAGTLVSGRKSNDNSDSNLDFKRAFGDLTLIPCKDVTVAIRYRFRQTEESVPEVVKIPTTRTASSQPDHPIDQRSNVAQVSVRYVPFNGLGLRAQYSFENVERHNAEIWSDPQIVPFQPIPDQQNIHKVILSANARPVRQVNVRGELEYDYTAEPELPVNPRNLFKGKVDADWTPDPALSYNLHYRGSYAQNTSARLGSRYDNPGVQAVWSPAPAWTATVNYDYFRIKDTTDFQLTEGVAAPDPLLPRERVPLRESSHTYTITAGYTFTMPLSVEAEYHQSWSVSRFRTRAQDAVVSASGIGELTDMSIREIGGGLTASYALPKGWGSSVKYTIDNFDDLADKPQSGHQDGIANTVLVMLTKKW